MLGDSLLLVAGLVILAIAAEALVRGSIGLAYRLKIPVVIVGIVLVGFGTSAPEMAVSVLASGKGQGGLAIGNLVGSNIANIALILGVAAVIRTVLITKGVATRGIPLMALGTVVFVLLLLDRTLSRWDGVGLVVLFTIVMGYLVYSNTRHPKMEEAPILPHTTGTTRTSLPLLVVLVLVGLAGVLGGAHAMVGGATRIALKLGVSQEVIGLTVVAVGTSLPELGTAVVASLRRVPSLTIGNVVGSNLFNLLAIGGLASLVRPIPADEVIRLQIMPLLLGITILFCTITWMRNRVGRLEGTLLLGIYVLFLVLTIF